jgi:hypothetical protein
MVIPADVFLPTFLIGKCVYWAPIAPTVVDGQQVVGQDNVSGVNTAGQRIYEDPIEVNCRWTDETSMEVDHEGNTFTARSFIMVDQDLLPLGVLRQGTIDQLQNDVRTPMSNPGALEIRRFDKIPSVDGTQFVRWAIL